MRCAMTMTTTIIIRGRVCATGLVFVGIFSGVVFKLWCRRDCIRDRVVLLWWQEMWLHTTHSICLLLCAFFCFFVILANPKPISHSTPITHTHTAQQQRCRRPPPSCSTMPRSPPPIRRRIRCWSLGSCATWRRWNSTMFARSWSRAWPPTRLSAPSPVCIRRPPTIVRCTWTWPPSSRCPSRVRGTTPTRGRMHWRASSGRTRAPSPSRLWWVICCFFCGLIYFWLVNINIYIC